MLKTIEIIKEQIKALKIAQKPKRPTEIQELIDLLEFINYDHQILESENEELKKKIQRSSLNARLEALTDALSQEKSKNLKLTKKLKSLESKLNTSNKSINDSGNMTARVTNNEAEINDKSRGKSYQNLPHKSPIKPPRADKSVKKVNLGNKTASELKNNISMAIEQAHKTLTTSKTGINRSISPCFSTSSSRYSTPSKRKTFNANLE